MAVEADSLIVPEWPAPARVRAIVTTRSFGDASMPEARSRLRRHAPADPAWLRQVHGTRIVCASEASGAPEADGSVARAPGSVCAVMAADCMPVLFADVAGTAVAAAHAGWRGLAAGVLEAALDAMALPSQSVIAWLGPAIGPSRYEVGEEVRDAFLDRDAGASRAFVPTRPGHWNLDLYAVARMRLAARGVRSVHGGGYCTYSEPARFFSFRRERTSERMAALVWIAGVESPPP